jgi:hypothetical protein
MGPALVDNVHIMVITPSDQALIMGITPSDQAQNHGCYRLSSGPYCEHYQGHYMHELYDPRSVLPYRSFPSSWVLQVRPTSWVLPVNLGLSSSVQGPIMAHTLGQQHGALPTQIRLTSLALIPRPTSWALLPYIRIHIMGPIPLHLGPHHGP